MSEEIKELLFLLHNDRLTKSGKRKIEQEMERLNRELEEYKKDFKEANDLALKLITNNQEYVCKSIKDTIDILIEKLQQKENVIKEAINCIKEESWFCYKDNEEIIDRTPVNRLLEILDKENK